MIIDRNLVLLTLVMSFWFNPVFAAEKMGFKPLIFKPIGLKPLGFPQNNQNNQNVIVKQQNGRINQLNNRVNELEKQLSQSYQNISTGDPIIDYHVNQIRYYESQLNNSNPKPSFSEYLRYSNNIEYHQKELDKYLNNGNVNENGNDDQIQDIIEALSPRNVFESIFGKKNRKSNPITSYNYRPARVKNKLPKVSKFDKTYRKALSSVVILEVDTNDGIKHISGFYFSNSNCICTSLEPLTRFYKINSIKSKTLNSYTYLDIEGVIGHSNNFDIVLLKASDNNSYLLSTKVKLGDEVLTIGDQKYCGFAYSSGIVTNINPTEIYYDFSSNSFNVGSPLLSTNGKVIGVITNSGKDNYAIPISFLDKIKQYEKPISVTTLSNFNEQLSENRITVKSQPVTSLSIPINIETNVFRAKNQKESISAQEETIRAIQEAITIKDFTKAYNIGLNFQKELCDLPIFNFEMAVCSYYKSNYLEAIDYCNKAINLYESNKDLSFHVLLYQQIGWSYAHLNDVDNAIINFEKALSYKPSENEKLTIFLGLGSLYFEQEKYIKSKYYLTKALQYSNDEEVINEINNKLKEIKEKK